MSINIRVIPDIDKKETSIIYKHEHLILGGIPITSLVLKGLECCYSLMWEDAFPPFFLRYAEIEDLINWAMGETYEHLF